MRVHMTSSESPLSPWVHCRGNDAGLCVCECVFVREKKVWLFVSACFHVHTVAIHLCVCVFVYLSRGAAQSQTLY